MTKLLQFRRSSSVVEARLGAEKPAVPDAVSLRHKARTIWDVLSALGRALILRKLNRGDIQAICILILAFFGVMLATTFWIRLGSRTVFGPNFGADFAAIYIAGSIYNSGSPEKIYDLETQKRFYREMFPDDKTKSHLLYTNAPFLVAPLSALARLSYPLAYAIWMLFSAALYVTGFMLLRRTLKAMPADVTATMLLLALSFMPFLIECIAGGQTAAIGFFSLAAAISFERRGWMIACGLMLSLCWYEPNLLLLVAPMLVITRRIKAIDGFLVGTCLLASASLLLAGAGGSSEYLKLLLSLADGSAGEGYKLWKYVDTFSFSKLLAGPKSSLSAILPAALFLGVLALLVRIWWRSERKSRNYQSLVWAVTLTCTLIANLYVGIYDSTLVVISAMLVAHVFYARARIPADPLPPAFKIILLLLFVVPWMTQPLAQAPGLQLFTLILALLAGYQFSRLEALRRQPAASNEKASGMQEAAAS
jgi:hypothetical protein